MKTRAFCSWLAAALALCGWSAARAAALPPLTLQDAVKLAVQRNPALAATGAALSAAQGSVLAARGLDDPTLSASSQYRLRRGGALDGPLAAGTSDQAFAALQLSQPLPTGGSVGLGLETSYARATADPALPAGDWTPALQLALQQPLLRGAGQAVARAEQRRASIGRDLARAARAELLLALLRDVVRGYWRLAHARRELEIRHVSAAAARAQLERVQANIAVGKLPPSATAEIEVVIVLRDDAVLQAEQGLAASQLSLARLCALPAGQRPEPAEPLPGIELAAPEPPGLRDALATALARSPRLQALRATRRAAAVELEVSADGLLPQLDLSIATGLAGSAGSLRSAYAQPASAGGYTLLASLSLELPLWRHTARGALELSRARSRQAQLDEADVAAQLAEAVTSSLEQLRTARRRAAVLVPSQRAATLDLEAEQARFDAGRASSFDVLRRQDSLGALQLSLLGAELQRLEAQTALDALTGELLARHGLRLEAADP